MPTNSNPPKAYFLTWTTYGTWLRGDPRGSVVEENRRGVPYAEPNPTLTRRDTASLKHQPVLLDTDARRIVHESIEETCAQRGWALHACSVRTNHVHAVVSAINPPEHVMASLKSWGTRWLRERCGYPADDRVWTKHGSTRTLFDEPSVEKAIDYVLRFQDQPRQ